MFRDQPNEISKGTGELELLDCQSTRGEYRRWRGPTCHTLSISGGGVATLSTQNVGPNHFQICRYMIYIQDNKVQNVSKMHKTQVCNGNSKEKITRAQWGAKKLCARPVRRALYKNCPLFVVIVPPEYNSLKVSSPPRRNRIRPCKSTLQYRFTMYSNLLQYTEPMHTKLNCSSVSNFRSLYTQNAPSTVIIICSSCIKSVN